MPNRVLFPVFNQGYLIAVNGRGIYEGMQPKYLTIGQKSEGVFNYENVEDFACICEGAFDALSVPHGVAILGKDISVAQINLLLAKYNRVYITLDMDAQAEKSKQELYKTFTHYIQTQILTWAGEKDPAGVGYKGMSEILGQYEKNI